MDRHHRSARHRGHPPLTDRVSMLAGSCHVVSVDDAVLMSQHVPCLDDGNASNGSEMTMSDCANMSGVFLTRIDDRSKRLVTNRRWQR